ncbi:MAG: Fic family protein [Bacteroidales bacterium]|nr:Fic family protein [Bacteroidales bacterium]
MAKVEQLLALIERYRQLGIDAQIDYDKFYLYSIITHSTALEGSTISELENQILFDDGISLNGKSIIEQMMNLDLKRAYEESLQLAKQHADITVELLKKLSHLVMQNTGSTYKTALGEFSSAAGDLRLLNVTAGVGGKSYLNYQKIPAELDKFCKWLNVQRRLNLSIAELYLLSFEVHYRLVTIHPWADGNGRMARLLMNYIQFEYSLIPTKVLKEDKEDYINALVATRESGNISHFMEFMIEQMIKSLSWEIEIFLKSMADSEEIEEPTVPWGMLLQKGEFPFNRSKKKRKSREKILMILRENPYYSARRVAEVIGITPKAVEKHLTKLKAEGLIIRYGPDKGGKWMVL